MAEETAPQVSISQGHGFVVGDNNQITNFWQGRRVDSAMLEAFSPHAAAGVVIQLPHEEAVVVLAGMPANKGAPVLESLMHQDEALAIGVLADMNVERAELLISRLTGTWAWLRRLPGVSTAVADFVARAPGDTRRRPEGRLIHVGPSPQGSHGFCQEFKGARIYWRTGDPAAIMPKDDADYLDSQGGVTGPLGFPVSKVLPAPTSPSGTTGDLQRFEGPAEYAKDVCDKLQTRCGSTVYRSERCGIHATWGDIGASYELAGGSGGWLGFPVTDQRPIPGGHSQTFESGIILRSNWTGAVPMTFNMTFCHLEFAQPLGFPVAPETDAAYSPYGTTGKCQRFERNYVIYFSEEHGAHPVGGTIGELHDKLGRTSGPLGFPIGDEDVFRDRNLQIFEGGRIFWTRELGAIAVTRAVIEKLDEGDRGVGFPVGSAQVFGDDGSIQFFEHGVVTVRSGVVEVWVQPK